MKSKFNNNLKLNNHHQLIKKEKRSTKKQLRDKARMAKFLNSKNNLQENEKIKVENKEILEKRKDNRKIKFLEQNYKKYKFYDLKNLKKQLKKAELINDEVKILEITEKMNYVNFYPNDRKYISIIKEEMIPEVKKARDEIFKICQERAKNYEINKIKNIKEENNFDFNIEEKDNFFVNEEEIDLPENFKIKKVDKTGKIIRQ